MEDYEIADAAEWAEEHAVQIDDDALARLLPQRTSQGRAALSYTKPQHTQAKVPPTHHHKQQLQAKHNSTWSSRPVSPPKKRPPRRVPNLVTDPDNDARAAWRSNREPNDTVHFPFGYKEGRPDLVRINKISRKTNTYVAAAADERGDIILKIWGTPEQVKAAKVEIDKWIGELYGPKKQGSWAHIPSLVPVLKKRQERKLAEEAVRQAFRQPPLAGSIFSATGFLRWPEDDDLPALWILGASLEAFDDLRMQSSCYITYDKATNLFKIMGDDADQVKQVLQRVRAAYYQVVASTTAEESDLQPATLLLQAPRTTTDNAEILLAPYQGAKMSNPSTTTSAGVMPMLRIKPADNEGFSDRELLKDTWNTNVTSLKESIIQSLRQISYYHGNLQMRVRLGAFLLMKYKTGKADTYGYEEFETMLQESQVVTKVTEEIGNAAVEQSVLARFLKASDMLSPQEVMTRTLDAIKPYYSAIFNVVQPQSEDILQVAVDAHVLADGTVGGTSKKWTKLDKGKTELQKLLNASLIKLESGSAWHFEICGGQNFDDTKLARAHMFADKISFDPQAASDPHGTTRFVKYVALLPVLSLQQKTAWRFNLQGTSYVCELAKIQRFVSKGPPKENSVGTAHLTAQEPRWSVSVFHQSWDDMLSEHAKLGTGARAAWEPKVDSFFPRDAFHRSAEPVQDGLEAFLRKLEEIETLVRGELSELDE